MYLTEENVIDNYFHTISKWSILKSINISGQLKERNKINSFVEILLFLKNSA